MFSHTLTTALEQLCPLSHDSCLNFFERVTLMHELYRVLSAISADTFSQHFRTYFIIPCNPMIYKHLKLLLRPEWNADIRTVLARQGLNIEKRAIHRMTLFSISLRARDVAERPGDVHLRRPQRSGDIQTVRTRQGSNIQKRRYPTDISFFCIIESTRRDSNPRPSPWQGDTPPLSHSCKHTFKTTY